MKKITQVGLFAVLVAAFSSCKDQHLSSTTGWAYNDARNGGFEVPAYIEQETGPGLVLIEGGTFVMGQVEQDVLFEHDNMPRRVTISSFYMDEAEVANVAYREYLHWVKRVFGEDYPEVLTKALPDTLVWRSKMGYFDNYVDNYLRHPAYNYYPVVGVSWIQANDYCAWRTDRTNEMIMVREKIMVWHPQEQLAEENFNTEAYLAGQYELGLNNKKKFQPVNIFTGEQRKVRIEDGLLLPKFRLPTEAEWEYAALALVGTTDPSTDREIIKEKRLYPWSGSISRNPNEKFKGDFLANFRRGRGDYMGSAGRLNDMADATAPVYYYWPNDFGLYHMAGNVSEWVMDVYRPLSLMDFDEFRPFRGNVFKKKLLDDEGFLSEKDSLGRIQYVDVTKDDAAMRRNYKRANYLDNEDGDVVSSLYFNDASYADSVSGTHAMYDYSSNTLINNQARVIKGGSWKDPAYWMVPGTRRFLDEQSSTEWIGFRCAMDRIGPPMGIAKHNRYVHRAGTQYAKPDKRSN